MKKSTLSTPNKYPAIDENTTLTDSLIFVISLKSETHELTDNVEFGVFKNVLISLFECECKDTLKKSYEQLIFK